ncbi:MAG: hypothetical protein HDS27_06575 [Bacteroides sp.]|nr:hypothetical protein [Bacteroides sp.]
MFNASENFNDFMEVLQFLKSRSDLNQVHKRVYKQVLKAYADDSEALSDIKAFKPNSFLGF